MTTTLTTKERKSAMGRPKTGRSPVITIRLTEQERAEFDSSIPQGHTITEVGRARLSERPDAATFDLPGARRALAVLDQEHYSHTSSDNRAHWMRQELFPDYEPIDVTEHTPKGARKTGKHGPKTSNLKRTDEGKVVEVRRDAKVKVVVSQATYDDIRLTAEALGLTLSTYCRRLLMRQPVFCLELHMGPDTVRRHAGGALAVAANGLAEELRRAGERLVAQEAEKIAGSSQSKV